jgi:SAM-dependent methyltransferase
MLKKLIEARAEHLNFPNYAWSTPKYYNLIGKFIKTLKTPKLYEGVTLPVYYSDMPKLEKNTAIYASCSKWFMQMGWEYSLLSLIDLMIAYPKGKTFIDVGSGTGNMVALANELGLKASGIEGSEVLPKLIPELKDLNIYNQDFFTFQNYNDFDLIYMWNPNPPRMVELGKLVTSQIKKKTAILGLNESAVGNPNGALDGGSYLDKTWKTNGKIIIKTA